MGTKKAVFTTSPTVFRQNAKTFNSKSEKKYHIICFSKKLSFVNMFFWTHWMQLSECRQKVFNEAAKVTRSISKTAKTRILLSQTKCFSQIYGIKPQNAVLTNSPKISRQMVKYLLLKLRKSQKQRRSFHRKPFCSKDLIGHVDCSFQNLADNFR